MKRAAVWALVATALFTCYWRQSQVTEVTSDGASVALQAWSMLHGNLLLHGWDLSDVSFYTTEIPQYLLIELVTGLGPWVVHIAAASTYTLLVLLAAAVAKGGTHGAEGLARALLAGGIIVAPQLDLTRALLASPDHVGSAVPVMLAWLVIGYFERRTDAPGWIAPASVCVILTVGDTADAIVLLTGIIPLLVACTARLVRTRAASRRPDLLLIAAAAGAAFLGAAIPRWVRAAGGYQLQPVSTAITLGHLGQAARATAQNVLDVFGADFLTARPGIQVAAAILHLVGVIAVCVACCIAAGRLVRSRLAGGRPEDELVVTGLLAGIAINLAAYMFTAHGQSSSNVREIAAVMPLGAALAGRVLGAHLVTARARQLRLAPALGVVAAGYLLALCYAIAQPYAPGTDQVLAQWLAAHDLTDGLAGYWNANVTTLDSDGRTHVDCTWGSGGLAPCNWETWAADYDPNTNRASFYVLDDSDGSAQATIERVFGPASLIYHTAGHIVLVWNENMLVHLSPRAP